MIQRVGSCSLQNLTEVCEYRPKALPRLVTPIIITLSPGTVLTLPPHSSVVPSVATAALQLSLFLQQLCSSVGYCSSLAAQSVTAAVQQLSLLLQQFSSSVCCCSSSVCYCSSSATQSVAAAAQQLSLSLQQFSSSVC